MTSLITVPPLGIAMHGPSGAHGGSHPTAAIGGTTTGSGGVTAEAGAAEMSIDDTKATVRSNADQVRRVTPGIFIEPS